MGYANTSEKPWLSRAETGMHPALAFTQSAPPVPVPLPLPVPDFNK